MGQAACSTAVSGLIANTGRIAVTAATMAGTCDKGAAYDKPISDSVWQMTRRLQGENAVHPTYDERGMELATCTLDVPQAATYLAMFGVAIARAERRCARGNGRNVLAQRQQNFCTADVFDILESLFMASSFVSSAISHCAPQTNQQALCASGALGVIGGISGLVKNAKLADNNCNLIPPFPPIPPPPPAVCPKKPDKCPAVWPLPLQKPCCPANGVCEGNGRVCICKKGERQLKHCRKGAVCYSYATIRNCDTGARCCSTQKINHCEGASMCTAPRIRKCDGVGTECNTQGW